VSRSGLHATTLLLLAVACEGGESHPPVCTLVGCYSGAHFDLGTIQEADFPRLTGANVKVCINTRCREGVIAVLPPANDTNELRLTSPLEDPRILVSLSRIDPSDVIGIRGEVEGEQYELFADGDVYTVEIIGSDSASLVDRAWSVSYQTWHPNGPRCEPTCRSQISSTEL
jgi:hypothetical protein